MVAGRGEENQQQPRSQTMCFQRCVEMASPIFDLVFWGRNYSFYYYCDYFLYTIFLLLLISCFGLIYAELKNSSDRLV